jgi:hypothetical protein
MLHLKQTLVSCNRRAFSETAIIPYKGRDGGWESYSERMGMGLLMGIAIFLSFLKT